MKDLNLKRIILKEFHETKYCPTIWRDLMTDFLACFTYYGNPYKVIIPYLKKALDRSGRNQIVDFGSGAGTYMIKMLKIIDPESNQFTALLSDKFPNQSSAKRIERLSSGRVKYRIKSLDMLKSAKPEGFWTIFSAGHHLNAAELKAFLKTAVWQKCGVGIFECSSRDILQVILPPLFVPILVWLVTPLILPFSWRRLFWTYVIPAVPALLMIDGVISHLRSFSVEELETLSTELSTPEYRFECGRKRIYLKTCPITYLIGYPVLSSKEL